MINRPLTSGWLKKEACGASGFFSHLPESEKIDFLHLDYLALHTENSLLAYVGQRAEWGTTV